MATSTLVDQHGRPIELQALKEEQAGPSLTGVRQIVGGHPAQGLTPQRLAGILREAEQGDAIRYLEMAEEMEEKDLHYLAVLGTRKRQVSQLAITVEAASDSAGDEANAALVRSFLEREEIEDELIDIMDAVGKGFSCTEIIWDTSERDWMPRRLEYRLPQWFTFDRADGATLQLRRDDGTLEPLAPFKFVTHLHKAKSGLPIRGGLARPVAWWFLFKNYTVKDWITFIEVYGQPLRVGKYHPGATPEDKRALLRALSNIGTDAAAMIPDSMMLEFVESKGASATSDIYEAFCKYTDQLISKAVLGQTATTDAIAGGHAVGQEHNDVRADIERSDCRQLSATLNRDLARPIVDLNRGPQAAYPKIVIGRPENVDVTGLSEALAKTVPLGLKVRQSEVRRKLGLEDPEPDDELLVPPSAGGMPFAPPASAARARASRRTTAARAPRDGVDDVADAIADRQLLDPLVDEIRGIVETAPSMEAVQRELARRYPTMELGDFADVLAEALIVAELGGRDEIGAEGDPGDPAEE